MEKFSAYRDPGTGIQPFLTPVPPLGFDLLLKLALPIQYILGFIRTALVLLIASLYIVLVKGILLVFLPIPPLYRLIEHALTYLIGRIALVIIGFYWIPVEQFNRKRGRGLKVAEKWNPKAGDVIVSNWASWVDVVWLAIRFNPIFVLPIPHSLPQLGTASKASTPVTYTPGRRTGTGSANVQVSSRSVVERISFSGFRQLSLLSMITQTGYVPSTTSVAETTSLEEIRRKASRPIVVFPECSTSNGRGLLRFADVFLQNVPVKDYQVFVMAIRYDPPTDLASTPTLTIPSRLLNPLPHIFTLGMSLGIPRMSVRVLAPSEAPGSQLFMASELLSDYTGEDQLSETCASLISLMGKLKRTGLGWENKSKFLDFYRGKN